MLLRQLQHQAQRFPMAPPARQLVDADGVEPAVRREHQELVRRLRVEREAMPVAFLELEVVFVFDMPPNRPDPAFHRADDRDRLALHHCLKRDHHGRRRIRDLRTAAAEFRLRPKGLAQFL